MFQSLTLPITSISPIGLTVDAAAAAAAYRHIFRDGELVLGQLPKLQVALLRELQVTQAATQVSSLLPQLPVGLLQLLLTQQDGVHFLLPQGLMLPASHRGDRHTRSVSITQTTRWLSHPLIHTGLMMT